MGQIETPQRPATGPTSHLDLDALRGAKALYFLKRRSALYARGVRGSAMYPLGEKQTFSLNLKQEIRYSSSLWGSGRFPDTSFCSTGSRKAHV